ncbi:hypothetical protein CORC01_03219 [Colletotrichum orchidophilum]|uniref:Uncharacterized protein n=1 Tax=Colletotrichum orchidophilum TaxID=1209926 RepID=A0A1G4BJI8_9PEZI|nr:uncharacterized protein CORC01_03219 [Colletotrichum orchidophilum]OHF01463.1 hypothetical protein CORC01_03219 [Colletotrichum orchidophilum]
MMLNYKYKYAKEMYSRLPIDCATQYMATLLEYPWHAWEYCGGHKDFWAQEGPDVSSRAPGSVPRKLMFFHFDSAPAKKRQCR